MPYIKALIDGDVIAYQSVYAATTMVDWDDGEGPQPYVDLEDAAAHAAKLIWSWTTAAGADGCAVMLSGRTGANFRKHIAPGGYKANRSDKPAGYWDVVSAIEARFKYYRIEGLEADDLLGIAGTDERWGDTVIVSIDKDMQTLPARIFNPDKDRRPRVISRGMADHHWLTQTLTGDACDGYKGCPKIGPVKAAKILGGWGEVVETFEAAGLTEDDAILQARLARILRAGDYDRKRKEVRLWHPRKLERFCLNTMSVVVGAARTTQQSAPSCTT